MTPAWRVGLAEGHVGAVRRWLWCLVERAHEGACWLIWWGHDTDWGNPADDDPVGICRNCQWVDVSRLRPL